MMLLLAQVGTGLKPLPVDAFKDFPVGSLFEENLSQCFHDVAYACSAEMISWIMDLWLVNGQSWQFKKRICY